MNPDYESVYPAELFRITVIRPSEDLISDYYNINSDLYQLFIVIFSD